MLQFFIFGLFSCSALVAEAQLSGVRCPQAGGAAVLIHDQSKNCREWHADNNTRASGILPESAPHSRDALQSEINGLWRHVLPKARVAKVALLVPGSIATVTDAAHLNCLEGGHVQMLSSLRQTEILTWGSTLHIFGRWHTFCFISLPKIFKLQI